MKRGKRNPQLVPGPAIYQRAVEAAPNAMVVDREERVRYANPAAYALLDRSETELLGQPLGFPLKVGGVTEIEITRPNGELRWVEARVVPVKWQEEEEEEEEDSLLATLRDMTERKKGAEAIQNANRELGRKIKEVESLNKVMMDREERILELKEKVKELEAKLTRADERKSF